MLSLCVLYLEVQDGGPVLAYFGAQIVPSNCRP
jgi:hypothetical protein